MFCRSSVFASSGCFFGIMFCCFFLSLIGINGDFIVEWFMGTMLFNVNFIVVIDSFSLMFSLVVLFISFMVMIFSTAYMMDEMFLARFIWLVMLFVVSMNLLIFIPSMIGVILGWDGLGLISFLLVVYYQNGKSLGAGMVTAFMNRVGDALLLLGVSVLSVCGHWSFWGWCKMEVLSVVFLFVVLLSCTKSAQFPFSYWLPAAMSAPTPVSALVHSSTLVTAGVYLLIRIIPNVFVVSVVGGWWLLVVSIFTLLTTGVSACFEMDMKKIVALSTLSQLGIMMFSLSLGYNMIALFHLFSHALFKALLFIGVGCVIHAQADWQDFRMMGGLWMKMPLVSGSILLAGLALSGLPFLGGFYSKDLIVESLMMGGVSFFLCFMFGLGLMMTIIYSSRLFLGNVVGSLSSSSTHLSESTISIYEFIPLFSLSFMSSVGGWFLQSLMFSFNNLFLLEIYFKNFVNFVIFCGVVLVFSRMLFKMENWVKKILANNFIISFFSTMIFMNYLMSVLNFLFLKSSIVSFKVVDLGWNEKVFGSLSLFDYFLGLNAKVVSFWYGVVGRCIVVSIILFLFFM